MIANNPEVHIPTLNEMHIQRSIVSVDSPEEFERKVKKNNIIVATIVFSLPFWIIPFISLMVKIGHNPNLMEVANNFTTIVNTVSAAFK